MCYNPKSSIPLIDLKQMMQTLKNLFLFWRTTFPESRKAILAVAAFAIISLACRLLSATPTPDALATENAATLVALQGTQTALAGSSPVPLPTETEMPGQTELPTQTEPPPATGSISGALSYPSEFIPPQRVVAINTFTGDYYYVDTESNQTEYTIENVPPSTYHIIAYLLNEDGTTEDFAGGYTEMVPCGYSTDCNDHSLLDVVILPGEETVNIDPGDWYGEKGIFPPDPTQ